MLKFIEKISAKIVTVAFIFLAFAYFKLIAEFINLIARN